MELAVSDLIDLKQGLATADLRHFPPHQRQLAKIDIAVYIRLVKAALRTIASKTLGSGADFLGLRVCLGSLKNEGELIALRLLIPQPVLVRNRIVRRPA